jgi:hypothetical protein
MSAEALILAVASAVRPSSSAAAVYALLAGERPRPTLATFTAIGLLFSVTVGLVIVSALHGVPLPGHASTRNAIIELAAGAAMLGFAVGAWAGRVRRPRRRRAAPEPSRTVLMLRRPTLKVAAVAGVVTHLPGLFYLVALNSIAAASPRFAETIVDVLLYNAIWFILPIAAFFVVGEHAAGARERIDDVNAWARRHERLIVVGVFASVGTYLVVKGITGLS